MTTLMDPPRDFTDVADWLGIEVLPAADESTSILRMRQLGKHTWSQRPGTFHELKLFRAVVALAKTMPVEGRDVVLGAARLREALGLPDDEPVTPDRVTDDIKRMRAAIQHRTEERDTARAAAVITNANLIAAVRRLRSTRIQATEPPDSPSFHRCEGELHAFDMVLRLLRGEGADG